jgi:hypothetical protein
MFALCVDGKMVRARRHERVRVSDTAALRLGGSAANRSGNFDGLIDELRIYARGLTDAEITALASGAAP